MRILDSLSVEDAFADELRQALVSMADLMEMDGLKADRRAFISLGRRFKGLAEAIESGSSHPLLDGWRRKRESNRPPPSRATEELRVVTAEISFAYQGHGLGEGDARERAAQIATSNSYYGEISKETVGGWERKHQAANAEAFALSRDFGSRSTLEEIDAAAASWIERSYQPISRWGQNSDVRIKEARAKLLNEAFKDITPTASANKPLRGI